MLKELTNSNWQLFFLIVCAAILPTGITLLPVVMVWAFFWFVTKEHKSFRFNFWNILLPMLFLCYAISFLYSENIFVAGGSLQWKLSFLFFPFLISTVKLNSIRLKLVLLTFVFSNIMIGLFLLLRVFIKHVFFGDAIPTYSKFSYYTHPSYISLFMIWALIIIFFYDINVSEKKNTNLILKGLALVILFVSILFCSSKIGMITMVIVMVVYVITLFKKLKSFKLLFIAIGVFLLITALFFNQVRTPLERFVAGYSSLSHEAAKKRHWIEKAEQEFVTVKDSVKLKAAVPVNPYGNAESTVVRMSIWKYAMEIVSTNFFLGVGIGDVTDELVVLYKKYHMPAAYIHRLNAHNQFLETQLGVGILGTLTLIMLTFGFLFYSLKKKNLMGAIFSSLMLVNLSVESMFQWEVACAFFTFFLLLLIKGESLEEN